MTNDKRKDIGEYVFVSKYARTIYGRKETWLQSVDRVMDMHKTQLKDNNDPSLSEILSDIDKAYKEKKILGAQRALQFGGEQLLKHHTRLYNCCASYLNRLEFFKEAMYLLLSGCGVGYSVQKHHISMMPECLGINDKKSKRTIIVPDSIEGWAEAVGAEIESHYLGKGSIVFDYTQIREKDSPISGGFKAPGYKPLKNCIDKVRSILSHISGRKLTSLELHKIVCIIADSVISGGVRRSAMICLFDADDKELMNCKTGDWWNTFPEFCRANNSVVVLPNTPKSKYLQAMDYSKQYGEPGVVFLASSDYMVNPCVEVMMYPQYHNEDGSIEYGWSFCNLVNVNGGEITNEYDFYKNAATASYLATIQATYTDFKVLSQATRKITERDRLIGVGIAGMCSNKELYFDAEVQRKAAMCVVEANERMAKILNISPAARTTCIKPDGNTSQLLGTSSGISPFHFERYIRNIQASGNEEGLKEIMRVNPYQVEKQAVYGDGFVISYPVEIDRSVSLIKQDIGTLEFLEMIKLTQNNWIKYGRNENHAESQKHPNLTMNVSNTVVVKDSEWGEVFEYLWNNRTSFCGVSLLPDSGDLDYPQAPYTSVLNEKELADTYGAGAIMSSGLIVDCLNVFDDIYQGCNAALTKNSTLLDFKDEDISQFIINNIKDGRFLAEVDGIGFSDVNCVLDVLRTKYERRREWVGRFERFAKNYFGGDLKKCSHCLKHVNNFHKFNKLRNIKPIYWGDVEWNNQLEEAGSQIGTACAGGSCTL